MKALAAFWLRFLMLAAFVMIAGFVFVRGQSPAIKVVDLIPASLSGETNQDSEPFLAVQAVNPQIMVASAFTSLYRSKRARLRDKMVLPFGRQSRATIRFTQPFLGGENSTAPLRLVT